MFTAELDLNAEGFVNFAGMDQNDVVLAQIEDFVKKGYLKRFDSLEDCTAFLGAPPKLSRFGAITKVRFGKLKRRIVLDVKQSRVKESTMKVHRVPLPRVTDVVYDILDSMAKKELVTEEEIELMVWDFTDALWNIPLAAVERKFFVGKLRDRFYVFLRAALGSTGIGHSLRLEGVDRKVVWSCSTAKGAIRQRHCSQLGGPHEVQQPSDVNCGKGAGIDACQFVHPTKSRRAHTGRGQQAH